MGEVKIKSGNLWNGSLISPIGGVNFIIKDDYMIPDPTDKDGRPWGYEFAQIKMVLPKGRYTICVRGIASTNINSGCDVYTETNVGLVKQHNLSGISLWIGNFTLTEDTNIGIMVKIFDGKYHIQLLEGTYTSETIPEYQPYFLNRPAHQFVNGQFVDIPTHHYTNGRWQGELTSQSPLKFWADGEMLDWRIEGKTSGNLYAIELGDDRWRTLANGQIISRTDGVLQIEMTSETNSGVYALSTSAISQLSDIRNTVSYSFDIRADTDISVLAGYEVQGARAILRVSNEWVTVKFENILFTQSYSFTIVNRSSGGTVYVRNFMFNEGSTALPYEPYGGVGDWDETTQRYKIPVVNGITTNLFTDHQLMDGDSIDYTTDQTAIPIATGNNVLTVDTAVQPSKVFVKFEG